VKPAVLPAGAVRRPVPKSTALLNEPTMTTWVDVAATSRASSAPVPPNVRTHSRSPCGDSFATKRSLEPLLVTAWPAIEAAP